MNERRIGYLIVTKSHLVAECNNLHPQLAHVQMSYTHPAEHPRDSMMGV